MDYCFFPSSRIFIVCGGLNETFHVTLWDLNPWYPVGKPVSVGLAGVTFDEDVFTGPEYEVSKAMHVSSELSLHPACDLSLELSVVSSTCFLSDIRNTNSLEP